MPTSWDEATKMRHIRDDTNCVALVTAGKYQRYGTLLQKDALAGAIGPCEQLDGTLSHRCQRHVVGNHCTQSGRNGAVKQSLVQTTDVEIDKPTEESLRVEHVCSSRGWRPLRMNSTGSRDIVGRTREYCLAARLKARRLPNKHNP
jgi:hypothetical protein